MLLSLTEPENNDAKKDMEEFSFEDKVKQCVVVLYDNELTLKGTGYIITFETLITPSKNLLEYKAPMKFMIRTPMGRGRRKIGVNMKYTKFFSVAHVSIFLTILCYCQITRNKL